MTQPEHGTCTTVKRGVLYTPNEGFCGVDSFTYTVSNLSPLSTTFDSSQASATAVVTVNVTCDDPGFAEMPTEDGTDILILNDDKVDTPVNTPVLISVLDNDENVPPGEYCI